MGFSHTCRLSALQRLPTPAAVFLTLRIANGLPLVPLHAARLERSGGGIAGHAMGACCHVRLGHDARGRHIGLQSTSHSAAVSATDLRYTIARTHITLYTTSRCSECAPAAGEGGPVEADDDENRAAGERGGPGAGGGGSGSAARRTDSKACLQRYRMVRVQISQA